MHVIPPGIDPSLFKLPTDPASSQAAFRERVQHMIDRNPRGRRKRRAPRVTGIDVSDSHRILVSAGEEYDQRTVDADLLERWPVLAGDEPLVLYVGKFLASKGVGQP